MNATTKDLFVPKTIVRRKDTGLIGVVCPNLPSILNCNSPEEVSVVYDGSTTAVGTDWNTLEVIGRENSEADLKKCGVGRGESACIFFVIGSEGPSCERFGSMRWNLIFRVMKAERNPTLLFPKCQF